MSRWVLYPLLLVSCAAALLMALTVSEVANLGARVMLQPGWIWPTAVLSLGWLAFLRRRRMAEQPPPPAPRTGYAYAAVLGVAMAGTLIFQLNQHSLGRPERREVVVFDRDMHRDWGGRRHPPALPVCTVTVPSWRSPGRHVNSLVGCGSHRRIKPGETRVLATSELGVTGMEFVRVNTAD